MNEYIRLADRINEIFELDLEPHDESRAFVRLFSKLLTRRDAEIACILDEKLRPASYAAEKTGLGEESVAKALRRMARKGVIYEHKDGSIYTYKLMPFVPGIFEAMVHESRDPEVAACLREYTGEVAKIGADNDARTAGNYTSIPVNSRVDIRTEAVPFEEISVYLDNNDKYAVMDCMCRTIHSAQGEACGHPIKDMCILIGNSVDYYVRTGKAREVSRDEVEKTLRKAEAEGLVHEMYPMNKSDGTFICNCCTCGCLFMGLSRRIRKVISYEGTVRVDSSRCNLCGICISRCPENVFMWSADGRGISIDSSKCFECGMCRLACPEKAIQIG